MYALSFKASGTLSASVPAMTATMSSYYMPTTGTTTTNYGFSKYHFYTIADTWSLLSQGMLFYRF
jgi:hypothetical protein